MTKIIQSDDNETPDDSETVMEGFKQVQIYRLEVL